jgi:hypothetical protein
LPRGRRRGLSRVGLVLESPRMNLWVRYPGGAVGRLSCVSPVVVRLLVCRSTPSCWVSDSAWIWLDVCPLRLSPLLRRFWCASLALPFGLSRGAGMWDGDSRPNSPSNSAVLTLAAHASNSSPLGGKGDGGSGMFHVKHAGLDRAVCGVAFLERSARHGVEVPSSSSACCRTGTRCLPACGGLCGRRAGLVNTALRGLSVWALDDDLPLTCASDCPHGVGDESETGRFPH